jgi:hypothetical protein
MTTIYEDLTEESMGAISTRSRRASRPSPGAGRSPDELPRGRPDDAQENGRAQLRLSAGNGLQRRGSGRGGAMIGLIIAIIIGIIHIGIVLKVLKVAINHRARGRIVMLAQN